MSELINPRYDGPCAMPDAPLLSPARLFFAVLLWLWWMNREPPVYIPLRKMLRFHRRPNASWRAGWY